MNYHLQNYCEVRPLQRKKYNPGTKRMYTNEFHEAIAKAKTVGDIIKAYRKAASTYGIHSDMSEDLHEKIAKAIKCKEPV